MKNEVDLSTESLQKAADVVSQLLSGFQTETTETERPSIVEENIILNPGKKLMLEKAIQDAPDSIICLAAFISEFAEQTRATIKGLELKLEKAIAATLEANSVLIKSSMDSTEMFKAFMETPAGMGGFQMEPGSQNPGSLQKAFDGEKQTVPIPRNYIIAFLENAIANKQATIYDISAFENTGVIPPAMKASIEASWKSSPDKFKVNN